MHIRIVRDGRTAYDGRVRYHAPGCDASCLSAAPHGLAIRDLDGDGEPEVIAEGYSGGAHCCFVALVYRYLAADGRYELSARNTGDAGYRLRDLDRDGRPEFVTADDAFAYAFGPYVFSVLPIQVLSFDAGRFRNVTAERAFHPAVRRDARRTLRILRRARRDHVNVRGALAAYAADEYNLGNRSRARRVLRAARRHHEVRPRFIRKLHHFLAKYGYR